MFLYFFANKFVTKLQLIGFFIQTKKYLWSVRETTCKLILLKDAQQQVFLEFQYFLLMLIIRNKRLTTKNYFRMRIRNSNKKIFHFAVNNSQIGTECGNQTETDQVSVLLSTPNPNVSFFTF